MSRFSLGHIVCVSILMVGGATRIWAEDGPLAPSQLNLARKGIQENGLDVFWNSREGGPSRLRAPDLGLQGQGFSTGRRLMVRNGGRTESDAIAVLDNVAGVYRIRDAEREFSVRKIGTDFHGNRHVKIQQVHQGLRVVGGDLVVQFDVTGVARSISGRYVPDIAIGTDPALSVDDALAVAMLDAGDRGMRVLSVLIAPELVVLASRQLEGVGPVLGYDLTLETEMAGLREHWRYWIDATTGEILRAYDNLKSASPGAGTDMPVTGYRLTEEGGAFVNTTGYRVGSTYYLYTPHTSYSWIQFDLRREIGASFINNGTVSAWTTTVADRSEISAYENFLTTANFYKSLFDRESYDDNGGHMNVYVHSTDVGAADLNRIWLGDEYTVVDILAHEYTHCLIDSEAAFIYDYVDSGAFHEGYADIFGALVEFYSSADGRGNYPNSSAGTADWLMGEDTDLGRTGGYRALRDLRNPAGSNLSEGRHPSRYKGSYWDDELEMHVNSTVLSHFFYLLCEGGSGNNDGIAFNVTGAGLYPGTTNEFYPRTMAYNVICNRATSENDYPEMRLLWQDEADDNFPAYASQVRAAWDAVGVADQWDPDDDAGNSATLLLAPTGSEQVHGTHLLTAGDLYDWFRVTLTAGTRYSFEATDGAGDTVGELYGSTSGGTPLASDNDNGDGSHFRLIYTPTTTKTHYLRVRGNTVGGSCEYVLSYKTVPPAGLLSVEINGATNVNENSTSPYTCTAYYDDTTSVDVTSSAIWSDDSASATINSSGVLSAGSVESDTPVEVMATFGGQSDDHDLSIINVPTPQPDFVINSIQLLPSSPTQGRPFTAYITISNSGTLGKKAGYLHVWTNKVTEAVVGEMPTKKKDLSKLLPGQATVVAITKIPANVAGSLTLRAFVDGRGTVAELSETNNQATLVYTVQP